MTERARGGQLTSGHDPLTRQQRRRNMASIRGADTKPELLIRRALHAAGMRYRLHGRDLPGRPDLVFPGRRAVIFVHGCFWHGHDCPLFRRSATRPEFWAKKIEGNRARDARAEALLHAAGWRTLVVWECAVRGPARRTLPSVVDEAKHFVLGERADAEVAGDWPGW